MPKSDNLTTILGHCHLNLNFLETSGHLGPVTGLLYLRKIHCSMGASGSNFRIYCCIIMSVYGKMSSPEEQVIFKTYKTRNGRIK